MKQLFRVLAIAMVLAGLGATVAGAATLEEKRKQVRDMTRETLEKLYELKPEAKKQVETSAGYAVFSNWGMKILVLGGGQGKGMAVSNLNRKETFMNMVELSGGLGFGAKKFKVVFLFANEAALKDFTEKGWQFGGRATVAATDGSSGGAYQGAVSVSPGIWMYEITEKGIALEVTLKGAKFSKNDLN